MGTLAALHAEGDSGGWSKGSMDPMGISPNGAHVETFADVPHKVTGNLTNGGPLCYSALLACSSVPTPDQV